MKAWDEDIDIHALRHHVADTLDWQYKSGARKVIRTLAPALLAHQLRRGLANTLVSSVDQIRERRQHFVNDGIPELRLEVVPADVVNLDLSLEEDNPSPIADVAEADEELDIGEGVGSSQAASVDSAVPESPSKRRKSPLWNPFAVEKMWVPETIVQFGVSKLVEAWHQKQLELLTDPKKFATRKCPTKKKIVFKATDAPMKTGALDVFFQVSKPLPERLEATNALKPQLPLATVRQPRFQPPSTQTVGRCCDEDEVPAINDYFPHSKMVLPERPTAKAFCEDKLGRSLPYSPSRPPRQTTLISSPPRGNSLMHSIIISSSPPPITGNLHARSISTKGGKPTAAIVSSTGTFSDVPATVTHRKKSKRLEAVPLASPAPTREKLPLSAFFGPRKPLAERSASNIPDIVPDQTTVVVKPTFADVEIVAAARDSLPGTWTEVISLNDDDLIASRGKPTISCVDLSGD